MAFVVRGKSGNIVGRYATQAEAERRIAQLRAGAARLRPFQFASGSLTQTEARNQAWSPTGEGRAAGLRRRNLGEIMAPWGSDFSYKAGPVGAVSSLYFAGEIYPDRTMVERALALIEADIVPAMRGENGWTKKDVADLQFIAAGLRYYLARDYKGQHSWPGKPRRHAHAARLGQRRAARSPTEGTRVVADKLFGGVAWTISRHTRPNGTGFWALMELAGKNRQDYPVVRDDAHGRIISVVYDHPERLPEAVKNWTERVLRKVSAARSPTGRSRKTRAFEAAMRHAINGQIGMAHSGVRSIAEEYGLTLAEAKIVQDAYRAATRPARSPNGRGGIYVSLTPLGKWPAGHHFRLYQTDAASGGVTLESLGGERLSQMRYVFVPKLRFERDFVLATTRGSR